VYECCRLEIEKRKEGKETRGEREENFTVYTNVHRIDWEI
jgi:hypothetical protein